ncbi:MAG: tRNA (adenosine(37)-N6)-threonylcarbamoyltransferase complex ATPase subunit type 1 TsaE [bacterium]|nr:tRNA (adenosine(37)-N6)-threonylcarbamoyltransferase complex ATPase subunit type 1 TsaE [bacterium]
MQKTTYSPEETINFGLTLAKKSVGGHIYSLIGDLGGGKTHFTKGFALGLGLKTEISSPSFILMKVYKVRHKQTKYFCHVDVYRLKRPGEILEVGLEEYLGRKDTITVIEWADKIKKILSPYKQKVLHFKFIDKNKRKITIN